MAKISALGHVGLAFEQTYGTAVTPTIYVPYNTIKVEDTINKVTDEGRRGVLSKEFGVYNTTRKGSVEIDSLAYPDTLGFFLKAIFGQDITTGATGGSLNTTLSSASTAGATTISTAATTTVGTVIQVDTASLSEVRSVTAVSGSGPYTLTLNTPLSFAHASGATVKSVVAPYTHTFQVLNALRPSVTVQDYNTITERQYAGAIVEEVQLKFDTEKEISMTAKMMSKASVTTTVTNPTITTTKPFLGYTAQLTLNGAGNTNLVGGEVTVKQEAKLIYGANNTQDPTKYATARIEASGKLTFDVEDESEFQLYLNGTQPTVLLKFIQDANNELDLQFSKVDITKAVVDRSQEFVRVDMDFKALYNTTDAGIATFTLKNQVTNY